MYRELLAVIVASGTDLGLPSADIAELERAARSADERAVDQIPTRWLTEVRARLGHSRTRERRALGTLVSALFHETRAAHAEARDCRRTVRSMLGLTEGDE